MWPTRRHDPCSEMLDDHEGLFARPGHDLSLWDLFRPILESVPDVLDTMLAGQAFSGAAPTTNPVMLLLNNVSVTPGFTGLSGAGLYQLNLTVPWGLGTGDVSLQAAVGNITTPSGVVISLQ